VDHFFIGNLLIFSIITAPLSINVYYHYQSFVGRHLESVTSNRKSIDAHLLEEHSCQISSRSDMKQQRLRLFWRDRPSKNTNNKMRSNMISKNKTKKLVASSVFVKGTLVRSEGVIPWTSSGLSSRNLEFPELSHDTLNGTETEGLVSLAYWNYNNSYITASTFTAYILPCQMFCLTGQYFQSYFPAVSHTSHLAICEHGNNFVISVQWLQRQRQRYLCKGNDQNGPWTKAAHGPGPKRPELGLKQPMNFLPFASVFCLFAIVYNTDQNKK